jgi:protein-disulfide isomerase
MDPTTPTQTRKDRRDAARAARKEAERAAAAHAARKRRLLQLGAVLGVALAAVVALIVLTGGGSDTADRSSAPASSAPAGAALTGIPQDGISIGRADAPVRLVEFGDLQCPFCADFSNHVAPALIRDYVATGKVRLEFRNMAFIGDDSVTGAHAAAAAAEQNRLWQFLEAFYSRQGQENTGYVTDEFLDEVYRAAGVDVAKARAFAETPAAQQPIDDADAMAQRYSIQSTPSFLIGTRGGGLARLKAGPTDAASIRSAIDGLLAER